MKAKTIFKVVGEGAFRTFVHSMHATRKEANGTIRRLKAEQAKCEIAWSNVSWSVMPATSYCDFNTVNDISIDEEYQFINDGHERYEIRRTLGIMEDFDSFFVKQKDGEYISVYGMYGIVPVLDKMLYKVAL